MGKGIYTTSTGQSDFALLIIRLAGLMMALMHGLPKLPPSDKLINSIDNHGLPVAILLAWLAAIVETGAGFLLALGLFTRYAAGLLLINMLVAAYIMHGGDGFMAQEKALLYALICVSLLISGAGKWSADRLIVS
jgi:putative oxidoreductase